MATITHHPTTGSTIRSDTGSIGLAASAIVIGGVGALFGLGGFVTVLLGDAAIPLDVVSVIVAGFALFALGAALFVRDDPGAAAVGMAMAPIAYAVLIGSGFGPWWASYQDAVATSGAAENAFWSAMPAMGFFAVSGGLLALASALAALRWTSRTGNV
jgi:hypothetical protein